MSDISTEEFLSHYGVKGMKWGQRRARRKERVANMSPEARKNRRKKIAKGVAAGAAVGAAAVGVRFVTKKMALKGNVKVTDPPFLGFRVKGKDWLVESMDAKAFEMGVSAIKNQTRRKKR